MNSHLMRDYISKVATLQKFDQSMFERLMKAKKSDFCMLQIQYRMHPSIRKFPSAHFYDNKLQDDASVVTGREQPYHAHKCFGPMVFFDLRDTFEQDTASGSVSNPAEAQFVFELFLALFKTYSSTIDIQNRVGIISPYRQQVILLRTLFKEYPTVNVDTVDGYQGREKEFIIFSCVRAPKEGKHEKPTIGFLGDRRRMNVAFTRPRSSLLVVGNSKALKTNPDWRAFVSNARTKVGMVEELMKEEKFNATVEASIGEHNAGLKRRQEKEAKFAKNKELGIVEEKTGDKRGNKKRPANQLKGKKAAAPATTSENTNNNNNDTADTTINATNTTQNDKKVEEKGDTAAVKESEKAESKAADEGAEGKPKMKRLRRGGK